VKRAVQSVLRQTYANYELIIIDDASKTPAFNSLEEISDPRIHIIRNDYNIGAISGDRAAHLHSVFSFASDSASSSKVFRLEPCSHTHADKRFHG